MVELFLPPQNQLCFRFVLDWLMPNNRLSVAPCVTVQRSDSEEQSGQGEQRASPARPPFGKKQLPSIPKNAVPITKPASPAASVQAANATHASYGPFYLEH